MADSPIQPPQIEAPEGRYPSRMDDRGRVKLPVVFQKYLEKFDDKRLFVTSLDRRIAQVYPMVLWKQTTKFMEDCKDHPEESENVAFNAADLGAETEMDSQARVTFCPELRKELLLPGAAQRAPDGGAGPPPLRVRRAHRGFDSGGL